ncbi:MAG: PocR ligand-binding domain-containing protein, partial [Candidatus Dormibacteria bacterium]
MSAPDSDRERPLAPGEQLLESSRYRQLVADFTSTTGLAIHAHTRTAVPLTVISQPREFCKSLQGGLDCPLYFDHGYHEAAVPEIRETCAGLGHVVIPVVDSEGAQILNLVSDACRLGPVDMERLTQLSFKLKIFPDQLLAQAEMVPLVARARLLFAAQILFAGLHELTSGAGLRADALAVLARRVAEAPADGIPGAVLEAVREFTGADFAYLCMVNEVGTRTCEASIPAVANSGRLKVLAGLADWCIHAHERIEIVDVAESGWCRHLASGEAAEGAMVGVPLVAGEMVFGAIVVGGLNARRLAAWGKALAILVDAG